jgi:hypothetical protein
MHLAVKEAVNPPAKSCYFVPGFCNEFMGRGETQKAENPSFVGVFGLFV